MLQPAMFMQGLAGGFSSAREWGRVRDAIREGFGDDVRGLPRCRLAAAIAFATDELVNGTFELAAGGTVTRVELAGIMRRYAGRDVTAVDLDPAEALAEMPRT